MKLSFRRKSQESELANAPISYEADTPTAEAETVDEVVAEETKHQLGALALTERDGFSSTESGLLVPAESSKVSVEGSERDLLVTDRRRITLETVEENFKAEQERLNAPLEKDEMLTALDIIRDELRARIAAYNGEDRQPKIDMERDAASLYRVEQLLKGEKDSYVLHVSNYGEDVAAGELLGRVVDQYASLTEANYGKDDVLLNSTGGTVRIPEDGVIHCEGYNGSILYEFARAKQVCDKLETMPKQVRETVLETGAVDASWLYDEPVVVKRVPVAA